MIGQFRSRHPRVRVRVTSAERPEEVGEAVRSGAVELGLTDRLDPTERDWWSSAGAGCAGTAGRGMPEGADLRVVAHSRGLRRR
ncbi:hypothetical protein [Streptomyces sp. NBC_00582]|uniref:hypothetical protein n=1 Tax=Streptomyces sp. NBC_00582 TaxID=2975783 RepID=UPI002E8159EB|nr:hypothetical protein [Streptomyces sp. NBC_00582]WUB63083.1 hypothetical protein OG852_23070 [Streptomyces sp. NBC_00582]